MARSWWEKFLDLFMEDATYEVKRQSRRPGRIEEMERSVSPRVFHHYPREGRMPAPTVVDQKGKVPARTGRLHKRKLDAPQNAVQYRARKKPENPRGQGLRNHRQSVESRRTREKQSTIQNQESQPVREKFTGVDFHASDVPSPVYGFRKRPGPVSNDKDLNAKPRQMDSPNIENKQPQLERNVAVRENHTLVHYNFPVTTLGETPDDEDEFGESRFPIEQTQHLKQKKTYRNQSRHGEKEAERSEQMSATSRYESDKSLGDVETVPSNVMMLEEQRSKKSQAGTRTKQGYLLPPLHLLAVAAPPSDEDESWVNEQRGRLNETLEHFNVQAHVVGVTKGPAVTRFEVQPSPGVKVSKIKKLSDDLKLNLAAKDIRIEAPIPGKSTVGIEIPNPASTPVSLREMIETPGFRDSASPLTAALGLDISGTPIITDLQKMPHGLISGATGSGKSVCINSLLVSLLYKASPDELKMILIDPKVVELAPFKDIPHLAAPVINDPKEASLSLKWAVEEMERRYECFAEAGARDIARYNQRMDKKKASDSKMPYIVIVIDELADLMMVAAQDVEDSICRIAQKARACGIHLVLATQRPSVDVITGLIKANIPTRIAFSVSSQADSRTILDMSGAEKLLGHGDMLFVENGAPQSVRVQGNFVSDDEIDGITEFLKDQGKPSYLFEKEELKQTKIDNDMDDELFEDAGFFVFEQGSASTSSLQRHFRIGYNRAARLIDMMEARGMISEAMGSKPRQLLMSEDEFLEKVLKVEA